MSQRAPLSGRHLFQRSDSQPAVCPPPRWHGLVFVAGFKHRARYNAFLNTHRSPSTYHTKVRNWIPVLKKYPSENGRGLGSSVGSGGIFHEAVHF